MSNKRDLVKEAAACTKNLQVNEIHKIKAAWDKFDLDGNGTVSVKEVDEFLKNLNIRVPLTERKHIEQSLDRNSNGTIEFVEFVKVYESGLFNKYIA